MNKKVMMILLLMVSGLSCNAGPVAGVIAYGTMKTILYVKAVCEAKKAYAVITFVSYHPDESIRRAAKVVSMVHAGHELLMAGTKAATAESIASSVDAFFAWLPLP